MTNEMRTTNGVGEGAGNIGTNSRSPNDRDLGPMSMIRHSQSRKDTMTWMKPFLHPKNCMKIAVRNEQTLNDAAKGIKLAREMD